MGDLNMSTKDKLGFINVGNKIKKCILILTLVSLNILLCSCGNSKNETIAKEYMDKVEQLNQGGVPTLQEVKNLDTEYYNLTPKQKELVTNYGTVKKYLELNLDSIHSVQSDIDSGLAQVKMTYKDIKNIEERYNKLSSEEKEYIANIDQLSKFKELDEYDKASVVAARFLKQSLKNGDSMEVSEINVKKEGIYYVKINYSATNSFGGRKDDVACLDVAKNFEIGIIGLSALLGNFEEASNTCLGGYIGFKTNEIPVDCDKVLDNIDKEF